MQHCKQQHCYSLLHLGELITEKSGILNLGVEGMISVGAVTGFMTAVNTENIFLQF